MAGYFAVAAQTPAALPQTLPKIRVQQFLHQPEAILAAVSMTQEGDVFHLKGAVEIRTDTVLLKADEASYNHETGEIEAHGDVKVTPTSLLNSRGQSQFGIK
jgi:lipopolysaccharide assembly outer membrane protein LptD (OstA)